MSARMNWKNIVSEHQFIASFSGGKDSVLALYKAMKMGESIGLISMLEEEGKRSRSHGMPPELLRAQADSIGLPLMTASASWEDYEKAFIGLLKQAKHQGADVLVTGDLAVPSHGSWHEKVTKNAQLKLAMPLRGLTHRAAVDAFVNLGFETIIGTVNLSLGMQERDLGRTLTHEYINELETRGIDPCGEGGEFHTTVIDGPLFTYPVPVRKGRIMKDGDYAFLPLELDTVNDKRT